MIRSLALKCLAFYQRFGTLLSWGSCRYYPTCSHYAVIQFRHNNLFEALWRTAGRIGRCNQLFHGGIDYPLIRFEHPSSFPKITKIPTVRYWLVPHSPTHAYIITAF